MTRRNIFLAAVFMVVIVLAAGGLYLYNQTQSDPIPLGPPSGELAFTTNREGNWDIMLMDTEGGILNLTAGDDAEDFFASFSFDSEMLNFLTMRDATSLSPGQVTPAGEDLRTLSIASAALSVIREGRMDWDPTWLPSGDQIVWASLRDFNLELYVGDTSGENRTRLTSDGGRDWFPVVSFDGSKVLFMSDRTGNENIYVINVDGTNLTQLTDSEWDDLQPMWSLDGTQILYIQDDNDLIQTGTINFYIMNADGSNKRPFSTDDLFKGDPTYSAGGKSLAYISNEEGNWNIYVQNTETDEVVRVTEGDADYLFPVWRPVPQSE